MNLLAYQKALVTAIDGDPVMRLAHAVAWLDPLWNSAHLDEEAAFYSNLRVQVETALYRLRSVFPDLYVEALECLAGGGDYDDLDRLICGDLNRRGIPLDDLEFMLWGVPMPAYGIQLGDKENLDRYPGLDVLMDAFGIDTDTGDTYSFEVPDGTYRLASMVADKLKGQSDPAWLQVVELIEWAFGASGNSSVAFTPETMSEIQPLDWIPDEVEFAIQIIEEADQIMKDVDAAMRWLSKDEVALATLKDNIDRLNIWKGSKHDCPQLEWPGPRQCTERETEPEPQLL